MMKGMDNGDGRNSTVSSGQVEFLLDGCDAHACVLASHNPSVHVYYALRSRMERSNTAWLQEFVSLGGLDSLLDSLCQMTGKAFTSFSDAILQIDCIHCIRAVLNTHVGIQYLLQSSSAVNKLIMGFELSNTLPKKQIVEMASALCAHSQQGYQCIMEGLDHLKRETDQYHRFSAVINELKSAETVPHKTALMTFINTIITCNEDLNQRCRIRNQMIGLTLLDVINFLQREETDDDLHIQLQTFHDRKHLDDGALRGKTEDLSSPSELAEVLQNQMFGTSRMVSLVNILQDLLAIELLEKDDKDRLWGLIEQQVHHLVHSSRHSASQLSSLTPRQVDDLLFEETQITQWLVSQVSSSTSNMKDSTEPTTCTSSEDNNHSTYDNFSDRKLKIHVQPASENRKTNNTPEPDLLWDLNNLNNPSLDLELAKPDLRLSSKQVDFPELNLQPPRPSLPLIPTQPSGIHRFVTSRRGSLDGPLYQKRLKQTIFSTLAVPFPSRPMRNLKWVKIQNSVIEWSKGCVWEPREVIPRMEPDYNRLETMFAETSIMGIHDEVALLAVDTRLKINLFLNRLEVEPDELVRNLIDPEAKGLTLPLLKYLYTILPCNDEMIMLKQYNGSLLDIGIAEQFLLHLMDIPDYHTLMLGHITRLQFSASISRLQQALRAMVAACSFLLDSQPLRDILHLVLKIGNFLNYGQFNGSANGLRLHCLKRLRDVSSVEPNHTVLHQVVAVVEESDEYLLRPLMSELSKLDEAARQSPEEIRNDVTALNAQLKQFVAQLSSAHPNISDIFHPFLEGVKKDFSEMQQSIAELRKLTEKVALYVCERTSTFNLQTCLQHVVTFLKDLRKARHENTLYKWQRRQARRRSDQFKTKLKHKRLALEFGKEAGASSSMSEDRKKVVECLLAELHLGNFHPDVPSPDREQSTRPRTENPINQLTPILAVPDQLTPPLALLQVPAATVARTYPERKKRPLELSHISIAGTPMINRPCSEIFDDDLFHVTPKNPHKRKVMTSSANDLLDDEECQQQKHPPKPQEQDKPPHSAMGRLRQSPQATQHHRSRSDLADSILTQNKWLKYEELKRKERQGGGTLGAPLAAPESTLTLATLNLEDVKAQRKAANDHLMRLNAGPIVYVPQNVKERKVDKKSSVGSFFSRLTRGVLKPRNTATSTVVEQNILRPSQEKHQAKPPDVVADKENFLRSDDPKRSSKRMIRFLLHKNPT